MHSENLARRGGNGVTRTTESFSLAEAGPSYTGLIGNERSTSARRSGTLDSWRSAMLAGGWTEYGLVYASITVSLNVAHLPVRTPDPPGGDDGKLDGAIVCTQPAAIAVGSPGGFGGGSVWGYDPGKYTEPPCSSFPYGGTPRQTFDIYKAALAEALEMEIVSESSSGEVAHITLQSPGPGPDRNGTRVNGWASGTVWGGGYNMRSGTYRGAFLSVTGREGPGQFSPTHYAWEMLVRVHRGELDVPGSPPQRADLWMDPARSSAYNWRICVCPYQYAIWMDEYGDGPETGGPYPRSAMVSMPWAPEGFTGHEVFAFVSTGNLSNFRGKLEWDGCTWFDAGPWSANTFRSLIVPVLRTRINPAEPDRLTTTRGMVVADSAYITARRDPASVFVIHNRIAGKAWNCCTVHDHYPASVVHAVMQDGTWVRVSSQSGPQKASVWWKVTAGDPFPDTARRRRGSISC